MFAGSASRAVRCLKLQSHQICQGFVKDLKHLERDLQIGCLSHETLDAPNIQFCEGFVKDFEAFEMDLADRLLEP